MTQILPEPSAGTSRSQLAWWGLGAVALGMTLVLLTSGGFLLATTSAFFSSASRCLGFGTGSPAEGPFALVAELNPAGSGNWQSAVRDGAYWYVDEARDSAGQAVIHRLGADGRELDRMVLNGGDHARSFAVVDGRIYHPFGDSVRVFDYRPGTTISRSQTKDTGWRGDFALDPSGRTAVLRNGGRYRAYDLQTKKRVGVEINISNAVRQGTGVQGTTLYILTGPTNAPAKIDSYSLTTGRALSSVDVTHIGLEGVHGNREPEGMYGSQFGVKVYTGDKRRLRIYQLAAGTSPSTSTSAKPATSRTGGYSDPVSPAIIGARFGDTGMWARYHTGLDYRIGAGADVRAVTAGTVEFAGNSGDWAGNHIVLRHDDGQATLYAHLSAFVVKSGRVTAGTVIGKVGSTGRAFGPHLHLEWYPAGVKPGDVYKAVDPRPQLAKLKQAGASPGASSVLTKTASNRAAQVRAAAARYFPADQLEVAVAVAHAESSLNPEAIGPPVNGKHAYGLWQIFAGAHQDLLDQGDWRNPDDNAKMAYTVWREQGWQAWSTYNSGSYKRFLSASSADQAAAPEADPCHVAEGSGTPASFTTGKVRTITEPSTGVTYQIPIPDGPAGVAINFALDQVGKPYVFGSQGPDTWDCSGLVSKAWKAAGVNDVYPQTEVLARDLPAVSSPQPGDLLYKPGHVQMYLMDLPSGQELIVEAPRTGKDVQVVPQWMNVTRTLRPGA